MKIVEAIIRVFLFFIGLVMKPILKIIFVLNYAGSYSEKVPAIRNPLCLLSATKLAKMIRNREVSKGDNSKLLLKILLIPLYKAPFHQRPPLLSGRIIRNREVRMGENSELL